MVERIAAYKANELAKVPTYVQKPRVLQSDLLKLIEKSAWKATPERAHSRRRRRIRVRIDGITRAAGLLEEGTTHTKLYDRKVDSIDYGYAFKLLRQAHDAPDDPVVLKEVKAYERTT